MQQHTVTFVTTLAGKAARASAESLLRAEQARIAAGQVAPWRAIEQLHFLSLFIVPAGVGGRPQLVLEANFDGGTFEFRAALVAQCRGFLDALYANCEGYPGPRAQASDARVREYLRASDLGYDVFFVSSPGRSTAQVEFERDLGARLEQRIASAGPVRGRRAPYIASLWAGLTAQDKERIQARSPRPWWTGNLLSRSRVAATLQLLLAAAVYLAFADVGAGCLTRPYPDCATLPPHAQALVEVLACAGIVLAGLALLAWFAILAHEFPRATRPRAWMRIVAFKLWDMARHLPMAVVWSIGVLTIIGVLAWKFWTLIVLGLVAGFAGLACLALVLGRIAAQESDMRVDEMNWSAAHMDGVRALEDRGAQNHFVSVTRIKPGWLRVATLRITLRAINLLWRLYFNPRGLSGIPSIHFARWLILPGGRRLLFVTNYDGAWGGYLTDFVTLAGEWMNAIWGHCRGFPRTYFLFFGGTRDEQRFKCYARDSQVETLLWYRRYPELTVVAIERNAAARADLARWAAKDFGARHGDYEAREEGIAEAKLDAWLRRF